MTTAGWALFFITIIVAVISRILAEDAKTFIPRLSQRLLRSAAQRLNEEHSARFFEEWMAHLEETPEITGKLWHATTIYLWGGRRVCHAIGYSSLAYTAYDRYKRLIDIWIVMLGIPFTFVVMIAIFIALYVQYGCFPIRSVNRVGRNGKLFKLYKFRTVPANSEFILSQHLRFNSLANSEWKITGKLKNDPRITGFGLFARKSSLDELPQLWNVLKGDMSLVGPRPLTPEQITQYPGKYCEQIRPGISGAWQVSGFSAISMEDMARSDTEHARDRSFSTDVGILLRTCVAVIKN